MAAEITEHEIQPLKGLNSISAELAARAKRQKEYEDALDNVSVGDILSNARQSTFNTQTGHSDSNVDYEERFYNPVESKHVRKSAYDPVTTVDWTEEDFQENRADQQSAVTKWFNGISKGLVLAGTTIIDGTAGFVWGLMDSFTERDVSKTWDNGITNFLNDVTEKSEELLPNYRSRNEGLNSWYANAVPFSGGFSNFWADTIVKNLGFTVGAIGSMAIGTGVASNVAKIPKLLGKIDKVAQLANKIKSATTAAEDVAQVTRGAMSAENLAQKSKMAESIANEVKGLRFKDRLFKNLATATYGAVGEGMIEGLQASKDMYKFEAQKINDTYDSYIENVRYVKGDSPEAIAEIEQIEEARKLALKEAEEQSKHVGNWTLALNIPVLTLSNALMFGKIIAGGFRTSVMENSLRQSGVKGGIKTASGDILDASMFAEKSGVSNNVKSNILSNLRKGAKGAYETVTEEPGSVFAHMLKKGTPEALEEMTQKTISVGTGEYYGSKVEDYYMSQIDPKYVKKTLDDFAWVTYGLIPGIDKSYLDPEAWQEGFAGFITGIIGAPMLSRTRTDEIEKDANGKEILDALGNPKFKTKYGITMMGSIWNERKQQNELYKQEKALVDALNNAVNNPEFMNSIATMISNRALNDTIDKAIEEGNEFDFKNAEYQQLVNNIILFDKAGKLSDLKALIEMNNNMSKDDLKGIIESVVKVNENGELTGAFRDYATLNKEGQVVATFDEDQEKTLREQIAKNINKLTSAIDSYRTHKNIINFNAKGKLDNEKLSYLTWLSTQLSEFSRRTHDVIAATTPEMKIISDAVNERIKEITAKRDDAMTPQAVKVAYQTDIDALNKVLECVDPFCKGEAEKDMTIAKLFQDGEAASKLINMVTRLKNSQELRKAFNIDIDQANNIYEKIIDLPKLYAIRNKFSEKYADYISDPSHIERDRLQKEREAAKKVKQEEAVDKMNRIKNMTMPELLDGLEDANNPLSLDFLDDLPEAISNHEKNTLADVFADAKDALDIINKATKKITESTDYTDEQKKALLERLNDIRNSLNRLDELNTPSFISSIPNNRTSDDPFYDEVRATMAQVSDEEMSAVMASNNMFIDNTLAKMLHDIIDEKVKNETKLYDDYQAMENLGISFGEYMEIVEKNKQAEVGNDSADKTSNFENGPRDPSRFTPPSTYNVTDEEYEKQVRAQLAREGQESMPRNPNNPEQQGYWKPNTTEGLTARNASKEDKGGSLHMDIYGNNVEGTENADGTRDYPRMRHYELRNDKGELVYAENAEKYKIISDFLEAHGYFTRLNAGEITAGTRLRVATFRELNEKVGCVVPILMMPDPNNKGQWVVAGDMASRLDSDSLLAKKPYYNKLLDNLEKAYNEAKDEQIVTAEEKVDVTNDIREELASITDDLGLRTNNDNRTLGRILSSIFRNSQIGLDGTVLYRGISSVDTITNKDGSKELYISSQETSLNNPILDHIFIYDLYQRGYKTLSGEDAIKLLYLTIGSIIEEDGAIDKITEYVTKKENKNLADFLNSLNDGIKFTESDFSFENGRLTLNLNDDNTAVLKSLYDTNNDRLKEIVQKTVAKFGAANTYKAIDNLVNGKEESLFETRRTYEQNPKYTEDGIVFSDVSVSVNTVLKGKPNYSNGRSTLNEIAEKSGKFHLAIFCKNKTGISVRTNSEEITPTDITMPVEAVNGQPFVLVGNKNNGYMCVPIRMSPFRADEAEDTYIGRHAIALIESLGRLKDANDAMNSTRRNFGDSSTEFKNALAARRELMAELNREFRSIFNFTYFSIEQDPNDSEGFIIKYSVNRKPVSDPIALTSSDIADMMQSRDTFKQTWSSILSHFEQNGVGYQLDLHKINSNQQIGSVEGGFVDYNDAIGEIANTNLKLENGFQTINDLPILNYIDDDGNEAVPTFNPVKRTHRLGTFKYLDNDEKAALEGIEILNYLESEAATIDRPNSDSEETNNYGIHGVKHMRFHTLLGENYTGSSNQNNTRALNAGTAVDIICRQFFEILKKRQVDGTWKNNKIKFEDIQTKSTINGKEFDVLKYIDRKAIYQLLDQLTKIKDKMDTRGEIPYAGNLVVGAGLRYKDRTDRLNVAGEIDLITIDKEGKLRIYDFKTSNYYVKVGKGKNDFAKKDYAQYISKKGANYRRSQALDYALQLNFYKEVVQKTFPKAVFAEDAIALLPFLIKFDDKTNKVVETEYANIFKIKTMNNALDQLMEAYHSKKPITQEGDYEHDNSTSSTQGTSTTKNNSNGGTITINGMSVTTDSNGNININTGQTDATNGTVANNVNNGVHNPFSAVVSANQAQSAQQQSTQQSVVQPSQSQEISSEEENIVDMLATGRLPKGATVKSTEVGRAGETTNTKVIHEVPAPPPANNESSPSVSAEKPADTGKKELSNISFVASIVGAEKANALKDCKCEKGDLTNALAVLANYNEFDIKSVLEDDPNMDLIDLIARLAAPSFSKKEYVKHETPVWNEESRKAELANIKRMLPQLEDDAAFRLLSAAESMAQYGSDTYGAYLHNVIDLAENAVEGTAYHEAFHAVVDKYMTDEEIEELFEHAAQLYGKQYSRKMLEEMLAEDFKMYCISRYSMESENKNKSFIRKVFDKILEFINTVFNHQDYITSVYQSIYDKKYANRLSRNVKSATKNTGSFSIKNDDTRFSKKTLNEELRTLDSYTEDVQSLMRERGITNDVWVLLTPEQQDEILECMGVTL